MYDKFVCISGYRDEPDENDLIDCDKYPSNNKPDEDKKACRVRMDELGDVCTEANDYGYKEGTPCVILKLNKVYTLTFVVCLRIM